MHSFVNNNALILNESDCLFLCSPSLFKPSDSWIQALNFICKTVLLAQSRKVPPLHLLMWVTIRSVLLWKAITWLEESPDCLLVWQRCQFLLEICLTQVFMYFPCKATTKEKRRAVRDSRQEDVDYSYEKGDIVTANHSIVLTSVLCVSEKQEAALLLFFSFFT